MKKFVKVILVLIICILTAFAYWLAFLRINSVLNEAKFDSYKQEKELAAKRIIQSEEFAERYSSESISCNDELNLIFNGNWNADYDVLFGVYKEKSKLHISNRRYQIADLLIKRIKEWPDSLKGKLCENTSYIFFVDGLISDGKIEYVNNYENIILLSGDKPDLTYAKYLSYLIKSAIVENERNDIHVNVNTNVGKTEIDRLEITLLHEIGHEMALQNELNPRWNQFAWDVESIWGYRGVYELESIRMKPNNTCVAPLYESMLGDKGQISISKYVEILDCIPRWTRSIYQWQNEYEYSAMREYCKLNKMRLTPETTELMVSIKNLKYRHLQCDGFIR